MDSFLSLYTPRRFLLQLSQRKFHPHRKHLLHNPEYLQHHPADRIPDPLPSKCQSDKLHAVRNPQAPMFHFLHCLVKLWFSHYYLHFYLFWHSVFFPNPVKQVHDYPNVSVLYKETDPMFRKYCQIMRNHQFLPDSLQYLMLKNH